MINLIDDGVFKLENLASHFRGMDSNEVFLYLVNKDFDLGIKFLEGLLTSEFLKLGGYLKFVPYLHSLGIRTISTSKFSVFMKERGLFERYFTSRTLSALKFYATIIIKYTESRVEFLKQLGLYNDDMSFSEINSLVHGIFGFDFDTAKDRYADHYFVNLKI